MESGRPIEEIIDGVREALGAYPDIDNVVFDLYGTLVDIHTDESGKNFWKKFSKLLRKNKIQYHYRQAQAEYLRLCMLETEKKRSKGNENNGKGESAGAGNIEIDISEVFFNLCRKKRAGITRPESDRFGERFRVMSRFRLKLYDTTLPMLEELKSRGYRIWLLSNAQEIFTVPELETLGLLPYFDGIAISSAAGVKKPDPAFAQYLFDRYGIDAGRCLMVGNEYASDVGVAVGSGMKYVYVVSNLTSEHPG